MDLGVLSIRRESLGDGFYPDKESPIPRIPPSHSAIIEWRALTVILLYVIFVADMARTAAESRLFRDRVTETLRTKLGAPNLSLPQVLESATWKGGREIAKAKRPKTGGPPIDIESDGTVF